MGFGQVHWEGKGNTTNLLTITPEGGEPTVAVKLLHVTQLPARHFRLFYVEFTEIQADKGETQLFHLDTKVFNIKGLAMANAVVEVGIGGGTTLIIENTGSTPIHLEEEYVLSHLYPVTMIENLAEGEQEKDSDPLVAVIQRED